MICSTCKKEVNEKETIDAYPFKGKCCMDCNKTIHKIGGHI